MKLLFSAAIIEDDWKVKQKGIYVELSARSSKDFGLDQELKKMHGIPIIREPDELYVPINIIDIAQTVDFKDPSYLYKEILKYINNNGAMNE